MCDADVDGSHIRCLLLTLIHEYLTPLLEEGRVFAAQPPLYTTRIGDDIHRAYSDVVKANGPAGANFRLMPGDIIVVP